MSGEIPLPCPSRAVRFPSPLSCWVTRLLGREVKGKAAGLKPLPPGRAKTNKGALRVLSKKAARNNIRTDSDVRRSYEIARIAHVGGNSRANLKVVLRRTQPCERAATNRSASGGNLIRPGLPMPYSESQNRKGHGTLAPLPRVYHRGLLRRRLNRIDE